jgi:hypothetical protein
MPNHARKLLLGLLGGSASFSPLSIAGLALWLDASDASTLFQNSNGTTAATADTDPVGYWGDKSGNGKHVIQATANARPLLKLAQQNGRNWVLFDGANDLLSVASLTLSTSTAFCVFKSSGGYIAWEHGPNVATTNGASFITDPVEPTISMFRTSLQNKRVAGGLNDNTVRIVAAEFTGPMAGLKFYINGVNQAMTDITTADLTASSVSTSFNVGARISGGVGTLGFIGPIAELLVYSPVLSDANRAAVETYLNAKWVVF